MNRWAVVILGLLAPFPAFALEKPSVSADQARAILKQYCYRCHGQDGVIEGGMNYLLDLEKLIARKKLLPGQAEASPLLKRMINGTMPPAGEPRPTPQELDQLKAWVNAGARLSAPASARVLVTPHEVQQKILSHLSQFDLRTRRFQRYLTLTHLVNAGLSDDELQTQRNALAKLTNSLSWNPTIHLPEAIDPARTIYRIDLRWYLWDATLWNRILNDYPYGILDDTATSRVIMISTASKMPILRSDWFVATASRAPLYYDLLQMPGNLNELERQLRVDSTLNLQQDRVLRSGFNGSGVSRFNRILERHEGSIGGMYWRTYDFEEPQQNLTERGSLLPDRRNVFAYPLGPGVVENSFQHAGGEIIFALPNGLHAYYLAKENNDRLDKAPNRIVSDPRRPDKQVEAGVSCMSCHVTGILPKADQIRDHYDKNPKAFTKTESALIKAQYPGKDIVLARMEEDMKNYALAVAKTGAKVSRTEAVSTMTIKYEADLDLELAAAEVSLTPEQLRAKISTSELLTKNLGALKVPGGTVSRQVWLQTFGDLVRELKLGTLFASNTNGGNLTDNTGELDPLEAQGNVGNAIAFTERGDRALIASSDRSVRIRDLLGARDQKLLLGHTASVWSVALAADGTTAISGSVDGTARIWDLTPRQEQERLRLAGHEGFVSAVAINANGTRAGTAGYDGQVIWWDASTGKELRRWEGSGQPVHALALHPTEPILAFTTDKSLILWNAKSGDVHREIPAERVNTLAFSPSGERLASGTDDRSVAIWDVKSGSSKAQYNRLEGLPRHLAWSPNQKQILISTHLGTVILADLPSQSVLGTFRKHGSAVIGARFQANGQGTITVDRDLTTHFWDIRKLLDAAPQQPAPRPDPPARIPPIKD